MKWYFVLQDIIGVLLVFGNIRLLALCKSYISKIRKVDIFIIFKGLYAMISLLSGVWLIINKWSIKVWAMFLLLTTVSFVMLHIANKLKKEADKNEFGKC